VTKAARCVRVLIVEDNPADAEILTEVLNAQETTRFDVEWVEYVRDGEERVGRLPRVDVALVDLKLPDADGLEALDRIHRSAPALPVFVMTGFDDEALAAESKRRGACGYLVKGKLGAAQLCAVIAAAVGNGAKPATAAAG
jgi:DNA-binding NarL/FixJ family response regulator